MLMAGKTLKELHTRLEALTHTPHTLAKDMAAADTHAHAQDWEALWKSGVQRGTRFDLDGPHRVLGAAIAAGHVPAGRALVPGCGRGYDVAALASAEREAVGLEVSPTAAAEARRYISTDRPDVAQWCSIVEGDFFTYTGSFTAIFDTTFLCALLPARRGEWAAQMHRLLAPGGVLLCGVFPLKMWPIGTPEDATVGPPFLLTRELYGELLRPLGFECLEDAEVPEGLRNHRRPAGFEAFQRWRRA
jgi:SAM-dependent methyltransferase